MAAITEFTITTYERRPGYWRAAIIPLQQGENSIRGKTVLSLVTPEDWLSEKDAIISARKIISAL